MEERRAKEDDGGGRGQRVEGGGRRAEGGGRRAEGGGGEEKNLSNGHEIISQI
jgi:hypothetical protein